MRPPTAAATGLGELRLVEVVTVACQSLPAACHAYPPGFAVGALGGQPVLKHVQATCLGEPLLPTPVAARRPFGALLAHRKRQPVRDHPHPGFQALNVGELRTPRQRPLIMRRLGHTARPPRGGLPAQSTFALRPRVRGVLQPLGAAPLQVAGSQRPQMGADQPQHLLILRGEALEPGTDRHPGGAKDDERRRKLTRHTHPVPLPHTPGAPVTHPTTTPAKRSRIRSGNSCSLPGRRRTP